MADSLVKEQNWPHEVQKTLRPTRRSNALVYVWVNRNDSLCCLQNKLALSRYPRGLGLGRISFRCYRCKTDVKMWSVHRSFVGNLLVSYMLLWLAITQNLLYVLLPCYSVVIWLYLTNACGVGLLNMLCLQWQQFIVLTSLSPSLFCALFLLFNRVRVV